RPPWSFRRRNSVRSSSSAKSWPSPWLGPWRKRDSTSCGTSLCCPSSIARFDHPGLRAQSPSGLRSALPPSPRSSGSPGFSSLRPLVGASVQGGATRPNDVSVVTGRRRAQARHRVWQLFFTGIGLVQAASQLRPFLDVLYLPKWLSALAVVASFMLLGRGRLSTRLAAPFSVAVGVVAIGLLAQIGDGLDARAVALAMTFLLTAITAFVIGPQTLARGWV